MQVDETGLRHLFGPAGAGLRAEREVRGGVRGLLDVQRVG